MIVTQTLAVQDPALAEMRVAAEAIAGAHPKAGREARQLAMIRRMQDQMMDIQTLLWARAKVEAGAEAGVEAGVEAGSRPAPESGAEGDQASEDAAPTSRLAVLGRAHANMVRATRLLMITENAIDDGRIARLEEIVRHLKGEQDRNADFERISIRATDEQVMAVQDVMEEMIEDEAGGDEDRSDRLLKQMYAALTDAAKQDGFAERCMGEVTAELCQALGFTPDWDDWDYKDWARREAELEIEGSPFCPEPRVVEDADGRYRFSSVKARKTGPPS